MKLLIENRIVRYLAFMLVGTLLASCTDDYPVVYDKSEFVKADTLKNEYANSFQIIYSDNIVKVNILNPEDNSVVKEYKINKDPKAYNEFPKDIERVVTTSTTQLGMMNALFLQELVVGVPEMKYLCHPVDESKVKAVGDIFSASAEAYAAVHPDIILYSGFAMDAPIHEKLEQAHQKTFLMYEWKENHPLGRAEWIKVYGVLFNKEKEAKALFNEIKTKYLKLQEKFMHADNSPKVVVGTYFGDVFNAPAGDSYGASFFKDVNADYVYSDVEGVGSLELTLEEMITKNKDTEYWFNMAASTRADLLEQNEKFKLLGSFNSEKLYSYYKYNDCFWESGAISPHLILEDIGKILHPELFEEHELKFYSKVD